MLETQTPFAGSSARCSVYSPMSRASAPQRSVTVATSAIAPYAKPNGLLRASLEQKIRDTAQLHALLCSLNLPILYLCRDLRLTYFTNAAEVGFGLTEADLGTKLDLRRPMSTKRDVTEIRRPGSFWQCRTFPHLASDGTSEGAMVILLAQYATAPDDQPPTTEAGLTPRERQIMDLVLAGHPSKNIAADLNISQRTVENHRAAIMQRTGATSLPALPRMAVGAARGADHRLDHKSHVLPNREA